MGSVAKLRPTDNPLTLRIREMMAHGPNGPMTQTNMVRRAESLGLQGLTKAEVNRLVQGKSAMGRPIDPQLSTLKKIASVFGIHVSDLVEGTVEIVTWGETGFQPTGSRIALTAEVVPVRESLVAIRRGGELVVIDPDECMAHPGAMMAIRHPVSGGLVFARAVIEELGQVRFTDAAGDYVFGDDSLCVGEVVAVLSRVTRQPSAVREGVFAPA